MIYRRYYPFNRQRVDAELRYYIHALVVALNVFFSGSVLFLILSTRNIIYGDAKINNQITVKMRISIRCVDVYMILWVFWANAIANMQWVPNYCPHSKCQPYKNSALNGKPVIKMHNFVRKNTNIYQHTYRAYTDFYRVREILDFDLGYYTISVII